MKTFTPSLVVDFHLSDNLQGKQYFRTLTFQVTKIIVFIYNPLSSAI